MKMNELFDRNLPALSLSEEGCCLDELSLQSIRKVHPVVHTVRGPAGAEFARLVRCKLDDSGAVYLADRVTGTVFCEQSGRSLSGTHFIDDGRDPARTIYPQTRSEGTPGRRDFAMSKNRLLDTGMAAETPSCFPSVAEGAAWGALSLRSKSSHTSYCHDCTPEFKRRSLSRGVCSHPETCFVIDEDALVGVSVKDRRFIKVMGFGPAPLDIVEKPDNLRDLVDGLLERDEIKNVEMKRFAMRFVRGEKQEA